MTEEDSSSITESSGPALESLHGHVGLVSVAHPPARSVIKNPMTNGKAIGQVLWLVERFIGVSRVTREMFLQANDWFSGDIREYWQIMYS